MSSQSIVRVTANGNSPWIPVSVRAGTFGVAMGVIPSSNAALVYNVQHTFDPNKHVELSAGNAGGTMSQTGTTVTVNLLNHGMTAGDSLNVIKTGFPDVDADQTVATVVNQNQYTFTVAGTRTITFNALVSILQRRIFPHATLAAGTTRADGNYAFPPTAIRLNVTSLTAGYVDLWVVQGSDA